MTSFDFDIDDKSRAGSEFVARVANEIRRAVISEKSSRKLTQQAIADKIGTSRAVINREISGLENLSARRIGELLWAIGWEPFFQAKKQQAFPHTNQLAPSIESDSDGQEFFLPTAPISHATADAGESTIVVKVGANAA